MCALASLPRWARRHDGTRGAVPGGGYSLCLRSGAGSAHVLGRGTLRFVEQASWVAVNDYEGKMLCERTGLDLAALSRKVQGLVVTFGSAGGAKSGWMVPGPKCRRWRPPRSSIPRAAAMHGVAPCSLGWSGAGPWSAALHWAIAWGLSKSQCVDHRTTHWISIPHRWAPDSIAKSCDDFVGFACRATALPALRLRDGLRNGMRIPA